MPIRGIEVDNTKIKTMSKLSPPSSVKAIRSFLGYIGCKIVRPLISLLEKDVPFEFLKYYLIAFKALKDKLTKSAIKVILISYCHLS